MTTRAPLEHRSSATASPIPEEAPVTQTTSHLSANIMYPYLVLKGILRNATRKRAENCQVPIYCVKEWTKEHEEWTLGNILFACFGKAPDSRGEPHQPDASNCRKNHHHGLGPFNCFLIQGINWLELIRGASAEARVQINYIFWTINYCCGISGLVFKERSLASSSNRRPSLVSAINSFVASEFFS